MSALETSIPQTATSVAIGASEATLIGVIGPTTTIDKNINSLPTVPQSNFRQVVIRGTVIITGAAVTVTLKCRQGVGIAGTQIDQAAGQPTAVAVAGTAVPFEFVDTAPVEGSANYTITATGSAGGSTAQKVYVHVIGAN